MAFLKNLHQLASLTTDQKEDLHSLGVHSLEQLISLHAIPELRSLLADHLQRYGEDLKQLIHEAAANIDASLHATLTTLVDHPTIHGALQPSSTHFSGMKLFKRIVHEPSLPVSVNLLDKLPPVYNQGVRNTCCAFVTSEIHDYCTGNTESFSQEYAYWYAKQLDGKPSMNGTYLKYTTQAVAEYGQCLESQWPYNPEQAPASSPPGVDEAAAPYKLQWTALKPTDVISIKKSLADGNLVGVSIPAYASWVKSQACWLSGAVTLPLPQEPSIGGHAICLAGYQDDSSYPGGGYFIFRNSWGNIWGYKCALGAGNGTIPYQYIADLTWECFTNRHDGESGEHYESVNHEE
ncbi:hypothetical protein GTO91_12750 [Heliobacterium undosum]|uniref:Peptidase C1A papain C-terminal domain-containing protein n=1 Tax=Heliomicrobium undosum TaxID=121734 RepID=A0A845L2V0_9FIRM|nr:C1 family peptidase [Heliomicrobium undosum]MZP30583.1 hypothetical protein [Heliomicrobium undosum]